VTKNLEIIPKKQFAHVSYVSLITSRRTFFFIHENNDFVEVSKNLTR